MIRSLPCLILLLTGLSAGAGAACAPREPTDGISEQLFVDVLTELRRAAREHPEDITAFQAERDRILTEAGVTDSALVRFVRARRDDPRALYEIWDSVAGRMRAPPELR